MLTIVAVFGILLTTAKLHRPRQDIAQQLLHSPVVKLAVHYVNNGYSEQQMREFAMKDLNELDAESFVAQLKTVKLQSPFSRQDFEQVFDGNNQDFIGNVNALYTQYGIDQCPANGLRKRNTKKSWSVGLGIGALLFAIGVVVCAVVADHSGVLHLSNIDKLVLENCDPDTIAAACRNDLSVCPYSYRTHTGLNHAITTQDTELLSLENPLLHECVEYEQGLQYQHALMVILMIVFSALTTFCVVMAALLYSSARYSVN